MIEKMKKCFVLRKGGFTFGHLVLFILCVSFLIINPLNANNKSSKGIETVVIDAGHGGKDPGAIVGKAREKDIVLDIALKLGNYIRQRLPNVKVVYTRSTDVFIPLFERSVIANKNNADLFISIHANYCPTPSIKGTETYVLGLHRTEDNLNVAKKENSVILLEKDYTTRYEGFDPNLSESYIMFELIQNSHIEQSVLFAGILQDSFHDMAQRANRDVRQAGFIVLRETTMPAVLIETGYLSNTSESNFLMTDEGRNTLALSIFNSLNSYKEKFESRLLLATGETKPTRKDSKTDTLPDKKETKIAGESRVKQSKVSEKTYSVPVKTEDTPVAKRPTEITFAVQISASLVKLPLNSKKFNGIENVLEKIIGEYYKYYCFESQSLTAAKQNLVSTRMKIPDAFIVAFKNGTPIPMKDALNSK